jgi:asparagine synthase (glutamine-hydrolysing)
VCGIAGTWQPRDVSSLRRESLKEAARRLARRGPDGEGIHVEAGLGLVHRRLAIIDLSDRGSQPMSVDGGRLWIVFNGEIYNHRELRTSLEQRFAFCSDSDTEVILRLYDAHADDLVGMLGRLRGMFAFALWDRERRRLLLARDRFGIKPLFVHESGGSVFFASTLDALAAFPDVPRRLDWTSLADQLSLLCPPGPATMLEGVQQLEPGTALVFDGGRGRRVQYWHLPIREARWCTPEAAAGDLEEALSSAAQLHLVADVEVGAFLSGGLDSGLVTSFASRHATQPLRTYSASFPGDEVDEGPWALEAAGRIGCRHTEVDVRGTLLDGFEDVVAAMDQPLGLQSAIPLFRLARVAARDLKVVLTGDGGDEVFAGYNRHRPLGTLATRVAWVPPGLRPLIRGAGLAALPLAAAFLGSRADRARWLLESLSDDPVREYLDRVRVLPWSVASGLLREEGRAAATSERHVQRVRDLWARWPHASPLHRMLAIDLSTTLVDEMMAKSDRMSMAWGLEARVPLLDHALVEDAFSIAPEALRNEGLGKLPLRRLAVEALGQDSAGRPKYGFNTSLARDLTDASTRRRLDELLEQALAPRLFAREAVAMLRECAEQGDHASAHGLTAVLTAGIWAAQRGLVA